MLKITRVTAYAWARKGWASPVWGGPTRYGNKLLLGFERKAFEQAISDPK